MNKKQWVQHISGQGEKWEVRVFASPGDVNHELQWLVEDKGQRAYLYYLPKSEYRLCDPPDEWEDVTGQCYVILPSPGIPNEYIGGIGFSDHSVILRPVYHFANMMLRLTRIDGMHNGPAFIIERKKT